MLFNLPYNHSYFATWRTRVAFRVSRRGNWNFPVNISILISAASAAMMAAAPSVAAPTEAPPTRSIDSAATSSSERVTYGDLDLASNAGRDRLVRRMSDAATRVCESGGMQTMEDFATNTLCYQRAMRGGMGQVDQLVAAARSEQTLAAAALTIAAPR